MRNTVGLFLLHWLSLLIENQISLTVDQLLGQGTNITGRPRFTKTAAAKDESNARSGEEAA